MKIIKIRPWADYDSIDFSRYHAGLHVSELISRVEAGEKFYNGDVGDKVLVSFQIFEIPEAILSEELLNFIRNEVQDYEDSKGANFWFENEVIVSR